MFRDEHMNSYTIFQSAQLLERFSSLQRTGLPADKLEQRLAPESINALMTEENRAAAPRKGNSRAREVQSASGVIDDYFNLVR